MPRLELRPMSRDELRRIDVDAAETFAMPTLLLMENAGRGAADLLHDRVKTTLFPLPRVLILCGQGNNGGDGFVTARHLELLGFPVRVVIFGDPAGIKGDAGTQFTILKHSGIDVLPFQDTAFPGELDRLIDFADWIVDGLLGTGLTRTVKGGLRRVIEAVNRSGKPVLSLDLPSGLDADEGVPLGVAARATITATFVAPKLGFSRPGADAYTGEVAVIDIGAPRRLLEPFQVNDREDAAKG